MSAAQTAFDKGSEAFKAGRYREAAGAFAEAYEQKPFPDFLYNQGAALEKAGDTKQAVQRYQLYLTMYPDAKDADKVRQHIHDLQNATGDGLMRPGD